MSKPKFNPNLPYEDVVESKPKFNPNLPYEDVETSDPDLLDPLAGVVGKVASGASGGFVDEFGGILEAGGKALGIDGLGKRLKDIKLSEEGPTLDSETLKKAYFEARDRERQSQKEMSEAYPITSTAAEIGGGISTAFIPGLNTGKIASLGGRVAANAALGGATGLGFSEADNIPDALTDVAVGTALGGGLTYGMEKAAPYAKKGWDVAKKSFNKLGEVVDDTLLPKFGRAVNNIDEDYTREYLNRKGQIYAPEAENIMDDLVGYHNKYETAYEAADEALNSSKDSFSNLKSKYANEIQDAKFDTRNLMNDANETLRTKQQALRENLKSQDLMGLKGDILDSVNYLKEQVSKGSSDSYKILEQQKGSVNINNALKTLEQGIDELQINGQAISDTANNSVKNLMGLRERMKNLGNEITFPQAKQILQQLDGDINIVNEKGSFAPEADMIKSKVRQALDSVLKENSEPYKNLMKDVAEKTELLSQVNLGFGSETKVINRLNNLASEKGRTIDRELLNRLGKNSFNDFDTPISKYLDVQDTLNTPSRFESIVNNTDEYRNHAELKKAYNALMDPENPRSISQLHDVQRAEREMLLREEQRAAAKADRDLFRNVSPNQVQNKMKALTGARDYGANEVFNKIDTKTGGNFSSKIKDRAILDSFEKSDVNGSRKTLAGALIGRAVESGIGAAVGYGVSGGEGTGAAVGAIAGLSLDRYGGILFKKLLDGRISSQEFTQVLAPKLGKFAKPIMDASARGNKALGATIFILQQTNQEFRKTMKDIEGTEE